MENESPIMLLMNDHRTVEKLFEQFKKETDEVGREKTVKKLCENLEAHMKIEETYLYPEMEGVSGEGIALIKEARQEHDRMKELVAHLKNMSSTDPDYAQKAADLEHAVNHHVAEEESQVFSFAQNNLHDKLGIGMATKMMALKNKEKFLG